MRDNEKHSIMIKGHQQNIAVLQDAPNSKLQSTWNRRQKKGRKLNVQSPQSQVIDRTNKINTDREYLKHYHEPDLIAICRTSQPPLQNTHSSHELMEDSPRQTTFPRNKIIKSVLSLNITKLEVNENI